MRRRRTGGTSRLASRLYVDRLFKRTGAPAAPSKRHQETTTTAEARRSSILVSVASKDRSPFWVSGRNTGVLCDTLLAHGTLLRDMSMPVTSSTFLPPLIGQRASVWAQAAIRSTRASVRARTNESKRRPVVPLYLRVIILLRTKARPQPRWPSAVGQCAVAQARLPRQDCPRCSKLVHG